MNLIIAIILAMLGIGVSIYNNYYRYPKVQKKDVSYYLLTTIGIACGTAGITFIAKTLF